MIVEPTATKVITPAVVMVAVAGVPLVYVMAPLDSEVGAVMVGAVAPKATLGLLKPKPVSVGVPAVTVKVVVVVLLA